MKKGINIILTLIFLVTLTGCSNRNISMETLNYVIEEITSRGYTLKVEDVERDGFLPANRKLIKLSEEDSIIIYYFKSNKDMIEAAANIKADGYGYEDKKEGKAIAIEWAYPPQLYKKDNIILLYVGEKQEIGEALKEIMGPAFAGVGF